MILLRCHILTIKKGRMTNQVEVVKIAQIYNNENNTDWKTEISIVKIERNVIYNLYETFCPIWHFTQVTLCGDNDVNSKLYLNTIGTDLYGYPLYGDVFLVSDCGDISNEDIQKGILEIYQD
jgi:hypothetical protein